MVRLWVVGLIIASATMAAEAAPSTVTFNKDVLPILQSNCQNCHRPGQVAPMSLLTYQDARPWARAMKTAWVTSSARSGRPTWRNAARCTQPMCRWTRSAKADSELSRAYCCSDSGSPIELIYL